METNRALRAEVLARCGADLAQTSELLRYNDIAFEQETPPAYKDFPLPDEPFVADWQDYVEGAKRDGAFATLQKRLLHLQFPIREGISATDAYQNALRRGLPPSGTEMLSLRRPESVQISLHSTPAGRIPVITTGDREDFVSLLRAFTKRSEPVPIAESMGACIVAGFNNWDRVGRLRKNWEQRSNDLSEAVWKVEFRNILPRKELYQDRFILLSDGPYSGVAAEALHLEDSEWRSLSLMIRREHECTHYFTRRVFSSMRNNLMDEMVADYMGIRSAAGHYRADWFLHFLGLENLPEYRASGRMTNYRGDPPLSDGAFVIQQKIIGMAAGALERFDRQNADVLRKPEMHPLVIITLLKFTTEELASQQGAKLLTEQFLSLSEQYTESQPPLRG